MSTFGNAMATQGPIGALESFLGSIFSGAATQPIYEAGGVEEFLQTSPSYSYSLPSGEQVNEYVLTGNDSIFFGTDGSFAGLKRDDVYEFGMFELTDNDLLRLWEGDILADIEDDLQLSSQVEKGQLVHFEVRDGDDVLLQVDPEQQDNPIYIEAPNPQDPDSSFNFWGAVFNVVPLGLSFFVNEGTAYAGEIKINPAPLLSPSSIVDVALLNGMRFLEWGIKDGNVPPYFESGNPFRNKLNSLGVTDDSIKPIPLFEGFGKNVWDWFQLQKLTGEIRNAFIQIRQNQGSKPFVPLAYSGAGRPLLQVLSDPYFNGLDPFNGFDVKTAILVGVPMLQGENVIKSPTLERIINIYGTNDPGLYTSDTQIPSIPKIYTHATNDFETINIELKDISHIEYFYQNGENPPLKQIRASNFIARLTQAALNKNPGDLAEFLELLNQRVGSPATTVYIDSNGNIQRTYTYVVDLMVLPDDF